MGGKSLRSAKRQQTTKPAPSTLGNRNADCAIAIASKPETDSVISPVGLWIDAVQRLTFLHLRKIRIPEETLESIDRAVHRQAQLEAHLETVVAEWRMKPVVEALQCLRGVAFIAATVVVSELGDLSRFAHRASPRPIEDW